MMIKGRRIAPERREYSGCIRSTLTNEVDQALLRGKVPLLKQTSGEQSMLHASPNQRVIASEAFVRHLGIAFFGFNQSTVDIERVSNAASHHSVLNQRGKHNPQSPFTIRAAVAAKPITTGVACGVMLDLSHLLVGFIVLKQSNVLQARRAIDEHFGEAQHVLTGIEAPVRAGFSEGLVDLLAKADLVSESVDENQTGSSCESFVGVFELQHRSKYGNCCKG